MKSIFLRLFFLIQINFLIAKAEFVNTFFSLDNNLEYKMIEYSILKSDNQNIFILNQPYNSQQVFKLLESANLFDSNFIDRYQYLRKTDKKNKFKSSLGINRVEYHKSSPFKIFIKIKNVMDFDNVLLVSSLNLDKELKDDPLFHGDVDEWATAFIRESYALYKNKNIELFGGRISRNLGILNEYSLILSNNPYPFDHYGFSVSNNKTKYSFYVTRLNNIKQGKDMQGYVLPNEITESGDTLFNIQDVKRYFAIQRFDFKMSDRFQGAVSASSVYGGPNQNFEAEYLNPLNVFYVSQRNSGIQMNNLYQFNLFYKIGDNKALYGDFLIDDIIINNEEGYHGTSYKDNRFGLIIKYSRTDFLSNKNLVSITYSRIWNETYLSHRNFENYIFFNKGIGYPFNSYESIKFSFSCFKNLSLLNEVNLEFYQKGNNEISEEEFFNSSIQEFPLENVKYGLILNMDFLYIGFKNYDISYSLKSDLNRQSSDKEINHKFKLVYNFQY